MDNESDRELIVRDLFQIMKEELNILERKVDLIKKLKTTQAWSNLRHDKEFITLARQYYPLNDCDIIAAWVRKTPRSILQWK